MNPIPKKSTSVRLSHDCLEKLERIAKSHSYSSKAEVIEFLTHYYLSHHVTLAEIQRMTEKNAHDMALIKSYYNQLRRENYLTHDLMNALCLHLSVNDAPPHHDKAYQTKPYLDALQNRDEYLKPILAKIRNGNYSLEEENDE